MSNSGRVKALYQLTKPCCLCPQNCNVDRFKGQIGKCRTGNEVSISSYNIHHGEEPPISGYNGSGAVFFTNCNLSCVFCQNYPISQLGNGKKVSVDELSSIMLELQFKGAHNINLVTPTHILPWIADAFFKAKEKGLKIPLVYNCGGYESLETLKLLEGVVDIYLPDAKYSNNSNALKYSGSKNYWEINKIALKEMYRQVGDLKIDKAGIAKKGLIIRHLVLPENISGSKEVLEFIAKEISPKTYLSIMSQYHTANKTAKFPEINRRITQKEYQTVLEIAAKLKLDNSWIQEL